jgi:predicted nucleotidyltransferase
MHMLGSANSDPREAGETVILDRCKTIVRHIVPDATVILYGSRARGSASPTSDFDLLVLVDEVVDSALEDRIGDALYEIEMQTDVVISAVIFNRGMWNEPRYRALPLHENIDREGIVL